MQAVLGILALLFVGTLLGTGMAHFNMRDEEKAALQARSGVYRAYVRACQWVVVALVLIALLLGVKECMGRSGPDCDYTSRGRSCSVG